MTLKPSAFVRPVMSITITVLLVTSFVHADEEGKVTGVDNSQNVLFEAKDAVVTVFNVARVLPDKTKHVSMKFSLKSTEVKALARSVIGQTETTWDISLKDESALKVRVKNLSVAHEISFLWEAHAGSLSAKREVCFDLGGKDVKWFNTYQQYQQKWPMDVSKTVDQLPFNALAKEPTAELQHIVEGIFLASTGFIIQLDHNSPLFYRIDPNTSGGSSGEGAQMCISAHRKAPYNTTNHETRYLNLGFTLYGGVNLRQTYITMAGKLAGSGGLTSVGGIKRPSAVPETHLLSYPIWKVTAGRSDDFRTTTSLTGNAVVAFAVKLHGLQLYHSVIALDSWWQLPSEYLQVDMVDRLRDIRQLVKQLNSIKNDDEGGDDDDTVVKLDNRLQLVVSPYVPVESAFFKTNSSLLVQDATSSSSTPYKVRDGVHAKHGLLDFSNDAAARWFNDQLRRFQTDYQVASFAFEAVTTEDVHLAFRRADVENVPGLYAHEYAKVAASAVTSSSGGKPLAVIVSEARDNQDLPLFVHMSPRVASWTDERGIRSLIPTALALSLAGYSFLVPDVVGGSEGPIADGELYARWAQATALMPAMQFATPPWQYAGNATVQAAAVAAIRLHADQAELLHNLANRRVNLDGAPLMRPMWWADPNDARLFEAGVVDTQFLLGDDIVVAPVLEQGKTRRSVYLPEGRWVQQRSTSAEAPEVREGGTTIYVDVDLSHLLWFKRQM